jgi:hypothetical protein
VARDYGLDFPDDVAKLFTAEDVETPAASYDGERIKGILACGKSRGGNRLKMYVLFGLILGYTDVDCAEIANADFFCEDGEAYIHRFRSKEARPKRGSRPIRIKHWVPMELAALIEAERGNNPEGYLFNSEWGNVLKARNVSKMVGRRTEECRGQVELQTTS